MIDVKNAKIHINGFPKSEEDDIRRCLTALYSVREGEQPLDRSFGLNSAFQDKPLPVAQNLLALEIIEKTRKYEQRVEVEKIDFSFGDGQLIPQIYIKKGNEAWG